ncbi:MAG: hypothetical protein K0S12_2366 [Bacteroidetes bacterium]|jgi:hypothetical protein|nr:hypothetical protein [Bacteroidota bacterium]
MKRGSRFLIGFAAAGLTFGSLMAVLGPQHFGKHCHSSWKGYYGHSHYNDHCWDNHHEGCRNDSAR